MAKWVNVTETHDYRTPGRRVVIVTTPGVHFLKDEIATAIIDAGKGEETTRPEKTPKADA